MVRKCENEDPSFIFDAHHQLGPDIAHHVAMHECVSHSVPGPRPPAVAQVTTNTRQHAFNIQSPRPQNPFPTGSRGQPGSDDARPPTRVVVEYDTTLGRHSWVTAPFANELQQQVLLAASPKAAVASGFSIGDSTACQRLAAQSRCDAVSRREVGA